MIDHTGVAVGDLILSWASNSMQSARTPRLRFAHGGFGGAGGGDAAGFGVPPSRASGSAAEHPTIRLSMLRCAPKTSRWPTRSTKQPSAPAAAIMARDPYAAFGLDPDGHNIEAVCHHAE
ncbi:MAG: hypothetical protein ACLPJW_14635 [Rhodomicrobium sp.]